MPKVGFSNRKSEIQIWGLIGAPGVSRSTREDQHLFVNRRPVENRGLNFALLEGYHTTLMKGRYPVCCLFLEVDPATVDVNIHPAKREVRFHNERDIRRLTTEAVRQTLLHFHSAPSARGTAVAAAAAAKPVQLGTTALVPSPPMTKEFPTFSGPPLPSRPGTRQEFPLPAHFVQPAAPAPLPEIQPARVSTVSSRFPAPPLPHSSAPAEPAPLLRIPLRLIGVIGRLYVVLESDRGLVLLDQHAAHERILFEQMLQRLEQGSAPSQRLLLPETVELSVRDALFLKQQLATLTRLGIGLSEFGERTFLLDALPPFVKVGDARGFVLGLADELKAAGAEVNTLRLGEHTIAKTVCRHAVKANDPLQGPELENLVHDLRHCAMPYTCPHGRPTLIEMNFRELEKKFGRVG